MRTNILLAIDPPPTGYGHRSAAAGLVAELVRSDIDHVVVLHVQEFSIGKLARNMTDHGGASGRRAVDQTVAGLRAAGVHASGLIREADFGHVARTIIDAADEFDVRLIVLGSVSRAGLPRLPGGGVAAHVLHLACRPVLVVPQAAGVPVRVIPRVALSAAPA
jgi:nucleotide-binding universal stress UspA family protein